MNPLPALLVLTLTPAAPLLVALALALRPHSRVLQRVAPWTALPGLVTGWLMPSGIAATVPWILSGSEFGLDDTGRVFLFVSAAVWLAGGLTVTHLVPQRTGRFFVFFLLTMSGSLGLTIARDLLSFYLFFSLMSFAAYGLVVHDRDQRAHFAGRVYLSFVLAADMMIFAALVLLAQDTAGDLMFEIARSVLPTATHGSAVVALLVLGFGVKLGVLGVHVTLPLIYTAAPVPGGVVLAGAMINAGLLGWMRVLPMGIGILPAWGRVLMVLGIAAAFYGALLGVLQRRASTVLAYSSISQMGIMTMAAGVGLCVDDGSGGVLAAVVLYALHHAFAKSALFLGTAVASRTPRRHALLVGLGLLLPALALCGAPLTSGMLAKEVLKESLSAAPLHWQAALKGLLPWLGFATTVVLGRFLWLAWPRGQDRAAPVSGPVAAVWLALLLLTASAAWLLPGVHPPALWTAGVLVEVSWPVLLGGLCCAAAIGFRWRGRPGEPPTVPPGDVLAVWLALGGTATRCWNVLANRLLPPLADLPGRALNRLIGSAAWGRAAATAERWLVAWPVAMSLLVLVILALWGLLLVG